MYCIQLEVEKTRAATCFIAEFKSVSSLIEAAADVPMSCIWPPGTGAPQLVVTREPEIGVFKYLHTGQR